jgi:hypothetical protein
LASHVSVDISQIYIVWNSYDKLHHGDYMISPQNPFKTYFLALNPYENNLGLSSACGAGKTQIVFLKASLRLAFKKQFLSGAALRATNS